MKIYFLIRGNLNESQYYLAEGKSYDKRKNQQDLGILDDSALVSRLKQLLVSKDINSKRKSLLYLVDFEESAVDAVKQIFAETKVKVECQARPN